MKKAIVLAATEKLAEGEKVVMLRDLGDDLVAIRSASGEEVSVFVDRLMILDDEPEEAPDPDQVASIVDRASLDEHDFENISDKMKVIAKVMNGWGDLNPNHVLFDDDAQLEDYLEGEGGGANSAVMRVIQDIMKSGWGTHT